MPTPIYVLIFAFVLLVLLGVNGVSPNYQWTILPVVVVVLVGMLYWLSTRTTRTTPSTGASRTSYPFGKWMLYGVGVIVLVVILVWPDTLYQTYLDSGFNFAEDTEWGRLIADQYGRDVADAAAWLPALLVLLALVFFVAKTLGFGTIVNLVYFAVLAVLLYGVWLIVLGFYQEHTDKPQPPLSREDQLDERTTKSTKYHGPFGTHRAQQVTLEADRWHSFDWEYQRCVFFYPRTGIETSEHNATQQYRLMSLGTSRTVWVRTLWVGESWTPPGSTTSNTC